MNEKQIRRLVDSRAFPGAGAGKVEWLETHISWVILSEDFAYKIKKPVRFSFLDFSTLDKRRHYCQRELELNGRLTTGLYRQVLPIRRSENGPAIGTEAGEVIDYALQMKRLDNNRQMNILLEKGKGTEEDMRKLARQLAVFHAYTDIIDRPVNIQEMINTFEDLLDERDFIGQQLGEYAARRIDEGCDFAANFLHRHAGRLQERADRGLVVDGHGDLHSKNIFLLDDPVIFDCIEFNDRFRQLDVLNEIAFFCMDLNFYGRNDLEEYFLRHYLRELPCIAGDEDWQIFHYFKLFRANVRLKVNALSALQTEDEQERKRCLDQVEEYFLLFKTYFSRLQDQEKLRAS